MAYKLSPDFQESTVKAQYTPNGRGYGSLGYNLCGLICIQTIILNHGKYIPIDVLFKLAGRKKTPMTPFELVDVTKKAFNQGFSPTIMEVSGHSFRNVLTARALASGVMASRLTQVAKIWSAGGFVSGLQGFLTAGYDVILIVSIDSNGKIVPVDITGHYVVVLSIDGQLTTVYNPFTNAIEEYATDVVKRSSEAEGQFIVTILQ